MRVYDLFCYEVANSLVRASKSSSIGIGEHWRRAGRDSAQEWKRGELRVQHQRLQRRRGASTTHPSMRHARGDPRIDTELGGRLLHIVVGLCTAVLYTMTLHRPSFLDVQARSLTVA